jgi:DNA-binding NarL/FixJ family response regulator
MGKRPDPRQIRVAVAHDSYLVREFLTLLLDRSTEVEQTAVCSNGNDLESAIAGLQPDVVLIGSRMPPSGAEGGIRIAARLRETSPEIGVVVLGDYVEPSSVLTLLDKGTGRCGYLLTERIRSHHELIEAIEAVAGGGSVLDPLIVDALIEIRVRTASSRLSELTPREREVLSRIALGDSNGAIAESLSLTKRAVEKHVNSIFSKLELRHRGNLCRRVTATRIFLAESAGGAAAPMPAVGH